MEEVQTEKRRVRQRLVLLEEQERLLAQTLAQTPKPGSATDLKWTFSKLPDGIDTQTGLAISEDAYSAITEADGVYVYTQAEWQHRCHILQSTTSSVHTVHSAMTKGEAMAWHESLEQ
jgi:hypothetical protein